MTDMLTAAWLVALAGFGAAAALLGVPALPNMRLRALDAAPARRKRTAAVPARLPGRPGRRLARERTREAVVELHRVFAAELRAGRPPSDALAAASAELEHQEGLASLTAELAEVTALARAGHDPASALRRAARIPGGGGLGYLAACWKVSAQTGSGLAEVAERLADGLAHDLAHRRDVSAQLAGPRATAVLLALLPLVGLAMGAALARQPLEFLFTTPLGIACLCTGLALEALGLLWTRRMVRRVLAALEPVQP